MGLRPRTARRLALAGGLLVLLVIGGIAFFTVPKVQNTRQLQAFERDGLRAHEEGRHHEAVVMLGRHLRGMGDREVSPEVRLAFARSRLAWESRDGGHVPAATGVLREYLRDYPDDTEVSQELLGLFVRTGAWVEARELAVRLRPSEIEATPTDRLKVLRHEARARTALNSTDPVIVRLEDRLLASEPPAFIDAWRAFVRAETTGQPDRLAEVLDAYIGAAPEAIGPRLLGAIHGTRDMDRTDAMAELARAIELDTESGRWHGAASVRDEEMVRVIVRALGMSLREDLSLAILEETIAWSDDASFARDLVRRRYWEGRHDAILSQPTTTPSGRFVADVVGYSALVHLDRDEAEQAREREAELQAHGHEYRATGWSKAIEARRSYRDGDFVNARARATEAIEQHAIEPTIRMMLGDIQHRLGRLSDALDAWTLAAELAEPYMWLEPGFRRVSAYLRAQRATEASPLAMQLVERSNGNLAAVAVLVETDATLARLGQIDAARAERARAAGRGLRDSGLFGVQQQRRLTIALAALEAALGNQETARQELARLMDSEVLDEELQTEILSIDSRFALGLSERMGQRRLPERIEDPDVALRAVTAYLSGPSETFSDRVREAQDLIQRGLDNAGAENRPRWLRTDAVFKDAFASREEATQAWRAAVQAAPDNVDLLTESLESNALGGNLEYVDRTIERIVQLTATQGRTLPSRLRLARANAVFGEAPNRRRREEALSIVRAVVTAEPQNVRARTMLANMLQFPSPPGIPENERFNPDPVGAIEQYLAAANLVTGSQVFGYLFAAFELQRERGNEGQARQIMLDIVSRAGGNPFLQEEVARRINSLTDRTETTRLLNELFANASGNARVTIGFQLVQSAIATDNRRLATDVLREITRAETLSAGQVTELAAKLRQVGMNTESDRVIAEASRYGLSETEARRVRANFALSTGNLAEAESMYTRSVEADPDDLVSWKALLELLMRNGESERAAELVDRALAHHPDDEDLRFWRQMASGSAADALRERFDAEGVDESIRLAFERVEAFDRNRENLSRDQQIAELREITRAFPRNIAVQKFVLAERLGLNEDPASIAPDAYEATRRFRDDEQLLRIAAESNLAASRYEQARSIATGWRGITLGSTLEPDLVWARAVQGLGNHNAVVDRLMAYLDAALASPDTGLNPALILVHSRSALRTSSESAVRQRLEPVARASSQFRSSVWIELAALSVEDPQRAAAWIKSAEQMGMQGSELVLIRAWSILAERFPRQGADFAFNAARIAGELVGQETERVEVIAAAAGALQLWASYQSAEASHETYRQAETLHIRAAQLDSNNLVHMFSAAICADRAGRSFEAERYYRTLLEDSRTEGLFRAAIRNNLAGILTRSNPTSERLQEAMSLIEQAIAFDELGPFFSTKGWIMIGLARHDEAVSAFRRAAELDRGSYEIAAGLAAAQAKAGHEPTAVQETLTRARELARDARPNPQLRARLAEVGIDW